MEPRKDAYVYRGKRLKDSCLVCAAVDEGAVGAPVPLYLDEIRHSPDGFEWGYAGSGPAQLAYALLRQSGATKEEAMRWHQDFKRNFIQPIRGDSWVILMSRVEDYIRDWRNFEPETL